MSTRTFVEGTEVAFHVEDACVHVQHAHRVSLRCRGCVISVADYNERRYGLHVIGLCAILSALQISLHQTLATVHVYVY